MRIASIAMLASAISLGGGHASASEKDEALQIAEDAYI